MLQETTGAAAMDASPLTPERIVKLAFAFREAKVVLSAVELGVFSVLAEGPLDLETLRNRLAIDPRGARDFFDALVALGMLERHKDGRYANTPECDLYLDQRKPTYVGAELEHVNANLFRRWNSLTPALRTGRAQSGAGTAGNYPALYSDPVTLEAFVRGMSGATLVPARALAAKFPWADYQTVIDIGCAQGCLPVQIAQAYSHITGGGFDLPPVKPAFDSYVQQHGLSHRLQFCPGDFFQDPLPTADVLVMGRVLHNWDMATKKMLLKKAYEALPKGGALVVYERMIDDERRTHAMGLLSSLNMLIMTAGGFDYTGADCVEWMQEAGFQDMRVDALTIEQSMVIGVK
jgi:cyclopropane fatty-acyl-phospholipid synthase-like methyltransferase